MREYLDGAEADLEHRGRMLLSKIPSSHPREFHLLTQRCQDHVTQLLNELKQLSTLDLEIRLRKFKRIVADLDMLEITGFAALNRATADDRFLNILIEHITREIDYPLLPPVVTSLSQGYFYIYPSLGLLCVPLGEADALLHLPDLYHELAHPLTEDRYHPRVQPFRNGLARALREVRSYILLEKEREQRSRGPQSFNQYIDVWWKSWNESWLVEFFCDLFATYTLGPAFVWSHIHLCAKRGGDIYTVPRYSDTSHPADDARLKVMLYGLELAGFTTELASITLQWQSLTEVANFQETPEYRRCFKTQLLEQIAEIGYHSVQQMRCRIATPATTDKVYTLLNLAWKQFWQNPRMYTRWEMQAIRQLRQDLNP